jgi:hypothetical protein
VQSAAFRYRFRRLGVGVVDTDHGSFSSEQLGDGAPEPSTCSGDQCEGSGETFHGARVVSEVRIV